MFRNKTLKISPRSRFWALVISTSPGSVTSSISAAKHCEAKKKICKTTCLRTYVLEKHSNAHKLKASKNAIFFENDVAKELFTSKEGEDSISSTYYKNFERLQQKL